MRAERAKGKHEGESRAEDETERAKHERELSMQKR